MVEVISSVCEGRCVRLSVLAELRNRYSDGLRKGYLDGLVKEQRIRRAFPGTPTHELQSYRKAEEVCLEARSQRLYALVGYAH